MLSILIVCLAANRSGALSIMKIEHDQYVSEISLLTGSAYDNRHRTTERYDELRAVIGTNDVSRMFAGRWTTNDIPYYYYLLDPKAHGRVIKAVSKTNSRTYFVDLEWEVCVYEFKPSELESFAERIIKWSKEELSDFEQQKLLTDLNWRGLYTESKYPEYALGDIYSTIGCFIPNDIARSLIWGHLHSQNLTISGKETFLKSIISQYEAYPEELRAEVIANVNMCMNSNFGGDSRLYLEEIRYWLRNQGIDAPSQILPVAPPDASYNPDDIFGGADYDYYRRFNPEKKCVVNEQAE
jgi:hypothetical protein